MAEQQQSILLDVEELDTVRTRGVSEKKDNDGNDKTSDLI